MHRALLRPASIALAFFAFATPVAAQDTTDAPDAPDARTVAATVQAFYDQTTSFEGRFVQTYYNRLYSRYDRSRGSLVFDKPGRMRFDYARPNGKVIVANQHKLTMWEPGDDGGPGQYMRQQADTSSLTSAFGFLTGEGRLAETYTFRLLRSSTYHTRHHVLELRPRSPDPRFRRILLLVDRDPARRGLVHTIRIDDHEGNRNKFELSGMRFNRSIASDRFAFSPPRGARRIHM